MKRVLTLCAALLLGFSSYAQTTLTLPGTATGSFNGSSATNPWYYTPPTNSGASSCAVSKIVAGAFTNNTNTSVRYATYQLTNSTASPVCVTLTLTPNCNQNNTTLLLTVFKGAYASAYNGQLNLTDFRANYLGDAGVYSVSPISCSVQVSAGETILAVVNTNSANSTPLCTGSGGGYTLTASTTAVTPLPVDLVSFKGHATPTGNALEWATASEHGNSGFVVERSTDGQHFVALGRVAGGGTRLYTSTYSYLDATPAALGYYRLRQQDIGGGESFSPIVVVQTSNSLSFFPNPVLDQATFSSPVTTRLTVRDGLGRICRVLPLTAGSQQISLATLPAGMYSVTNEATHQTMRLVKADEQ